jgi:ABC-type cobalamin/Fe3+-siderophores transport system ATPase subunit
VPDNKGGAMINSKIVSGNFLGTPRAESDLRMLAAAFVETEDFRALIDTRDFNFVVGRRGTGKSALFLKVSESLQKQKSVYLYYQSATEYDSLDLLSTVIAISKEYHEIRELPGVRAL